MTTLKLAKGINNIHMGVEIHLSMKITHYLESSNLFHFPIRGENLVQNIRRNSEFIIKLDDVFHTKPQLHQHNNNNKQNQVNKIDIY